MRVVPFFLGALFVLSCLWATQAETNSETRMLSISGVRPGMTVSQVIDILGPPVARDTRYPFSEEEINIWPIDSWLHYEFDCFSVTKPSTHRNLHIGLDREGKRVVFVGGPTLEANGEVVAGQAENHESLKSALGARGRGWSADSCYAYYPGGVLVRGCGDVPKNEITYYLRDLEAEYAYNRQEQINREQKQWERRTKRPKRADVARPRPGQLTMLGVYLGMSEKDLKTVGLPFERSHGVSERVRHYDLGDPRTRETIRATVFDHRVVYIDGYRLEKDEIIVAKVYESRVDAVERSLGEPTRKVDGSLIFSAHLLQVYHTEDRMLDFLSLGVQPEGDGAWPPKYDSNFTVDEVRRYAP